MLKLVAAIVFVLGTGTAQGAKISWTKWKHDVLGLSGSAYGVIDLQPGHVVVRYSGEVEWAILRGGEIKSHSMVARTAESIR
jgi:hypothetical protein